MLSRRFWNPKVAATALAGAGLGISCSPSLHPAAFLPFPTAYARAAKKAPVPAVDPNLNPIDSFIVPIARPPASSQNILFPGVFSPSRFKPPVPTLSSGLSLEEQATVLETTCAYGIPGVENILVRRPYVLSYNFRTKNANWVAEHHWQTTTDPSKEATRSESSFMKDYSIPAVFSQSSGDYLKSGWSRGHLAPAASHNIDQDDMQQTFSFANIVPQDQSMNEGDWLHLERFVRHLSKHYGNVRVVTGPLYIPADVTNFTSLVVPVIGSNEIHVPTHLFKVIYCEGKDAISHCRQHVGKNKGCDLNVNILRNAARFSFPTIQYKGYFYRLYEMLTSLPDNSNVKSQLMTSFDWRTRLKNLFAMPIQPNEQSDIVVMAFIMKNDKTSFGKPLEQYMVKLPYVETLAGLCLTPRQDPQSITMATWNN